MVYGFMRADLEQKVRDFLVSAEPDRDNKFNSTAMNPAHVARAAGFDPALIRTVGYRPLDRRQHYNSPAWNDRPRPDLVAAWGAKNVALFCLPSGTNAGPAAWAYSDYPDRHAFRGSYGGYAFPLFDRRAGQGPYNLKAELVAALGAAYGSAVTPEAVFDAMLCLLSARSYTLRFAEDLEDVFPHIPFPSDRALFDEAARLGAEIRAVETFARPPGADYLRGLARAQTAATGVLAPVTWVSGDIRICADGSGHISNIPAVIWEFAVSGYRLLPRWLAAREGMTIGPTFIPELRDVAARIAELIDLFDAADSILDRTLDDSLSRAALALEGAEIE